VTTPRAGLGQAPGANGSAVEQRAEPALLRFGRAASGDGRGHQGRRHQGSWGHGSAGLGGHQRQVGDAGAGDRPAAGTRRHEEPQPAQRSDLLPPLPVEAGRLRFGQPTHLGHRAGLGQEPPSDVRQEDLLLGQARRPL